MEKWIEQFYKKLTDPTELTALFDVLPDILFYAKDKESRFTMANVAELNMVGVERIEDFVGKTDYDFFDKILADLYIIEDKKVLAGERIINRQWMVPDKDGQMNWYLSTKFPLRNMQGEIVGLCGLLRDLKKSGKELKPYYDLSKVIDYVNANFKNQIRMQTLADLVGLSISQLDRKFKDFTGVSPTTYITKVRLAAVATALRQTDRTISELALDNGFYDHSQLIRYFKEHYRVTPSQYRKI